MRETTAAQCSIHPLETQPCPTCNEGTRAGRTVNRSKLPLSAFGDILGHNYWMDATSLMKLWRRMQDAAQAEQTSGGVDGHAAIFGECVRPERQTPIANPTAGIKPGPLDHQSAATPSTSVGDDAQHGAAQAVTDGPAADPLPPVKVGPPLLRDLMAWTDPPDPIADLARDCEIFRGSPVGATLAAARDALERLARERSNLLNKCASLRAERDVALDTLAEQEERAERAEAERDALRECVRAADAMRAGLHQLMARYRGHSRRT